MLDQMTHFDLRNARCTLEIDRVVIQKQVLELFDEALEPPLSVAFDSSMDQESSALIPPEMLSEIRHLTSYPSEEEVIDQFNAYVRGPLCNHVITTMGREEWIHGFQGSFYLFSIT